MTRRTKKLLVGTGATLLLPVLAVVLLPLWFPWALRPVANRFGATFQSYERLGYTHFAVAGAEYTNAGLRFRAERIETGIPTALLWNRLRHQGSDLTAWNWSLSFSERSATPGTSETNAPAEVVSRIQMTLHQIDDWLARAALTNGVVTFQQRTTAVPWLVWQGTSVDTRIIPSVPKLGAWPADISLNYGEANAISASIDVPGLEFRSALTATGMDRALTVYATNFWRTNRVLLDVRFGDGWLPESASLLAPVFRVAESNLLAGGYEAVDGTLQGAWTNGAFEVRLSFEGTSANTNLPPISGALLARGDTNSATLQELRIESMALRADLSNPVQLSYGGELLNGAARFSITGDLSRPPITDWRGAVRGQIDVRPSTNRFPELDLAVAVTNMSVRGLAIAGATAKTELRWPWLRVRELNARLDSGAEANITATANLTNRFLSDATLRMTGQLPTNFVPSGLQYSNLTVVAEASGPLTNLVHRADLAVSLAQFGPLIPLNFEFHERGEQFMIEEWRAFASGHATALEMSGAGEWNAKNTTASLQALNYWRGTNTTNTAPLYALDRTVDITVARETNAPVRIQITPLLWRGDGRQFAMEGSVRWPDSGSGRVAVEGLRTSDFTNLLASPVPFDAVVNSLKASARWSNGPVFVSFDTSTQLHTTSAPPVTVTLAATNNAEAMNITALDFVLGESRSNQRPVKVESEVLLSGEAILPVSASGGTNGFAWQIHSNAPARLELHTTTNDALRSLLAEFAKVRAVDPSVQVSLGGTIRHPQGTIQLSAASVAPFAMTKGALPQLEDVRAEVTLNLNEIRLQELRATLAGQSVVGTAVLPIADHGDWTSRVQLDQGRADLRMASAELAAFAPFATNLLAPRGTLDMALTLRPGMELGGHISVTDAATAPFPTIGPVQDIDAQIRLRDRSVVIESIAAHVGGAPLLITGRADFAKWKAAEKLWPEVQLRVVGTNLALVRQAQKIIRADLAIQITNAANRTPSVVGVVHLRDSLFLANLADLVPRGVTKPSQRPPYFSVDAPLVREWPLDVQVRGDKFLTLRSPLFRGEVSANLNVRGPLGEPVAVGEVRINSGGITFPFATLTVKQGFVTLGSANPYNPQLFVIASGRAYDYDVRLEVTGSAQDPILAFTSVPPLTSEQILLMVTSGQVPRSDFSLTTGQRAQSLGMFLGKNVLSQFGVGGGGENLTIRSGENISESGRSTYSVEYKLTEDVSLVGEYDRFDAYNAGVQWKVFSK